MASRQPFPITSMQAIDSPQITDPLRKKALHVLCKLCGIYQLLPADCVLGEGLVEIGAQIGRGGSADVRQSIYQGAQVAIKQLMVNEEGDFTRIYMVNSLVLQECQSKHSYRGSAER